MGLAHKLGSFHANVPFGRLTRNANVVDLLIRAEKLKESPVPEKVALAAHCFYTLGYIHINAGKEREARGYFEQALQLKPGYNPSLEGLGSAPISRDDRQKKEKEELRDLMRDYYTRERVETKFLEFARSL